MAEHPCIATIDAQLEKANTRLATSMTFDGAALIIIATEKRLPSLRGKARKLFASFCPFCGASLSAPKLAVDFPSASGLTTCDMDEDESR